MTCAERVSSTWGCSSQGRSQEHQRESVNMQCLLKPRLGTGSLSALSVSRWPCKSCGQSQHQWIGMQKNTVPTAVNTAARTAECGCVITTVRVGEFGRMTPSIIVNFKISTVWDERRKPFFFKILFTYFKTEEKGRRKRGRETLLCGCLSHTPYWGHGPKPRRVPWLGT